MIDMVPVSNDTQALEFGGENLQMARNELRPGATIPQIWKSRRKREGGAVGNIGR